MTKFLARAILRLIPCANHRNSKDCVILVWIAEIIIFAVVFPLLFRWLGLRMEHLIVSSNFFVRMFQQLGHNIHAILATSPKLSIIGGILLGCGLFLWIWATYSQWKFGRGTPVLATPTAQLVIKGPYRFTRNPIQLGTMLLYAGLGLLQQSYCIALVSLVLYGSAGSWYNMKLEEKELLARFGEEYHWYRSQVPFLIPRFWNGKLHQTSRIMRSK
ncbi:MAG: isoprenylcysteine carboxylmethyltransferase family protein [Deltaproteobacteria bacterium]|nr:isoprenylcysteine carboxylmethyltransferase family protein [Deltaproteobacteria bacterium]MBW2306872.1 isoprenylcysteine carboxylmethyltransferase family protein [Deltaproteobacteria bacterium]